MWRRSGKKQVILKGITDAVNITDNQTAVVRMASWAAGLVAIQEGLEPNYQMVCRDRNRIAMQSDILGAYAHGIRNMLCFRVTTSNLAITLSQKASSTSTPSN